MGAAGPVNPEMKWRGRNAVEDPSGQVFWNEVIARNAPQAQGKKLGRDGFTRGRPAHRFRPRAGGWPHAGYGDE